MNIKKIVLGYLVSTLLLNVSASFALAQNTEPIEPSTLGVDAPRASEFEYWHYVRTDIPIENPDGLAALFVPDTFKTFTLARTGTRYQGPGIIRFSTGPLWNLNEYVTTGVLGEFIYLNPDGQSHKQEYRIVPEVTLKGKLDFDLSWKNRNWLEYRIFPTSSSLRYRNMSRLNWKVNSKWMPFVSGEVFYDLDKGFNQSRARIGVGYTFEKGTRLDIGYLALHRKDTQGWYQDHALTLFLYFMPPS